MNQSINQANKQSINQSVNESVRQSVSQSINQSKKVSYRESFSGTILQVSGTQLSTVSWINIMELGKDFALRGCNRDRHTEDLSTNLLYQ